MAPRPPPATEQSAIDNLASRTQRNEAELATVSESLATLTEILTTMTRPDKPKIPSPDMFYGDQAQLQDFLSVCRNQFTSRPSQFPSEREKVTYASGYLREAALVWYNSFAHNDPSPPELDDFEAFAKSLEIVFGDPDQITSANTQLDALRQTTSVTAYATKFRILQQHSDWNNGAFRYHFLKGLKREVYRELIMKGAPVDLDELILAATRIDKLLYNCHLPTKNQSPDQVGRKQFSKRQPQQRAFPRPFPETANESYPRFQPLSDAEKQRRRANNLCAYCASPDHALDGCPARPKPRRQTGPPTKGRGTPNPNPRSFGVMTAAQPGTLNQGNASAQN